VLKTIASPLTDNELLIAPLSGVYAYLTGKQGKKVGNDVKFLCFNHPDTEPSLFIDDQKGCGHCFGCDWKFNRWSLLKEFGIKINRNNRHHPSNSHSQPNTSTAKAIRHLKELGKEIEAREIETCATHFEVRKCQDCGETFTVSYHCDHRLCPICNCRHVARFLKDHQKSLDFKLEIWGITLAYSGRPLFNNGKTPMTNVKALLEEARKALAELRRKYEPFGLFQHALVVRQLKINHGVAYLKVHLLLDTTRKEVEILRAYWANHYRWSPVRTVREFWTVSEAIEWLKPKASNPLEEWETPEDLGIWLEATKHMPLIYGLGKFRKVRGGRGQSQSEKDSREPAKCPFCGSTNTIAIRLIGKQDAWLWDKRYPPPDSGGQNQ